VSFFLAFRLALLSHNVGALDRARIRGAIWHRMRHRPLEFLWPAQAPHTSAPLAR
jgi:site-specific recombinase